MLCACLEANSFKRYDDTSSAFSRSATGQRKIKDDLVRKSKGNVLRYANETAVSYGNILELVNSKENCSGKYVKVLLASRIARDAINVKNVLSIHLVGPEWNQSNILQATSRGIRVGSHEDLVQKRRDDLASATRDLAAAMDHINVTTLAGGVQTTATENVMEAARCAYDAAKEAASEPVTVKVYKHCAYSRIDGLLLVAIRRALQHVCRGPGKHVKRATGQSCCRSQTSEHDSCRIQDGPGGATHLRIAVIENIIVAGRKMDEQFTSASAASSSSSSSTGRNPMVDLKEKVNYVFTKYKRLIFTFREPQQQVYQAYQAEYKQQNTSWAQVKHRPNLRLEVSSIIGRRGLPKNTDGEGLELHVCLFVERTDKPAGSWGSLDSWRSEEETEERGGSHLEAETRKGNGCRV